MRGTCRECGSRWTIRADGGVRYHRSHRADSWHCPGSNHAPREGILVPCIWCSRPFLSEDEGHRFCSEACVQEWTDADGSWDGWPVADWIEARAERADALAVGTHA